MDSQGVCLFDFGNEDFASRKETAVFIRKVYGAGFVSHYYTDVTVADTEAFVVFKDDYRGWVVGVEFSYIARDGVVEFFDAVEPPAQWCKDYEARDCIECLFRRLCLCKRGKALLDGFFEAWPFVFGCDVAVVMESNLRGIVRGIEKGEEGVGVLFVYGFSKECERAGKAGTEVYRKFADAPFQ